MNSATQELRRYWFAVPGLLGFGVTAYSIDDARFLLEGEGYLIEPDVEVTVDVDVSTLDPKHILPNAGPSSFRGVWFPCLNIGWREPSANHPSLGGNVKPAPPFVCQTHVATNDENENS